MIFNKRFLLFFLIIFFVFGAILCLKISKTSPGEQKKQINPQFSYQVSGCQGKKEQDYSKTRGEKEKVDLRMEQGFLNLTHYLNYLCCAKMVSLLDSAEELRDYTLIKIKERNDGEVCRCMCEYQLSSRIGPLAEGKYRIEISGIEFEDIPADPLWQKEITVDERGNFTELDAGFCGSSTFGSCQEDADCKKGGCSNQICQSVSEEPRMSDCQWKDCYNAQNYGLDCGCREGKCGWK